MNPLVIRAVSAADRRAACELLAAQLADHDLPVDAGGVEWAVNSAIDPAAGRWGAWLVLAEFDDGPVGILLANPIVSVEKAGAALWIEELYVVPSRRRQGVARALLDHAIARARVEGLRALDLEVVLTHGDAVALYRSFGFESVDRGRFTLNL